MAAAALSLLWVGTASAQQNSNHDFSVENSVFNQCTGEWMVVSLQGKIVSRPKPVGGGYVFSITSQLNGTASGEWSGTRYRFVGAENVDFERDTLATELVLWNNVRILTRGGQSAYIGYDLQTISTDENGEVAHVDHTFDFACD